MNSVPVPARHSNIFLLILLLSLSFSIPFHGCSEEKAAPPANTDGKKTVMAKPAIYTGGSKCAECHQDQYRLWKKSHHDLAMQESTKNTVLGNFEGSTFAHFGVTSTFSKQGKDFLVHTEGPDGKLQEYKIKYTFGVTPLQQYIIEFPGGRYQALGIAWDSRSKEKGGQRWFHRHRV